MQQSGGGENPYLLHQELGDVMTKAATVVRHNDQLREAYDTVRELNDRAQRCSLSDTGNWTNQNVVFTKALLDMFPLAKTILLGACSATSAAGPTSSPSSPAAASRPTIRPNGDARQNGGVTISRRTTSGGSSRRSPPGRETAAELSYEDVDTSLIPPRPRLYGLRGAEMIEEVWNQRQAQRTPAAGDASRRFVSRHGPLGRATRLQRPF